MQLKHKVISSFLAFIVVPFLIVGGFSVRKSQEMTKEQVSLTMFRLVKQNAITVERTLYNMNEKTLKFIEEHFIETAKKPIDPQTISNLSEYNAVSDLISDYTLDGTRYALFVPLTGQVPEYTLDSGKKSGLIYTVPATLPDYYEEAAAMGGSGILRIVPLSDSGGPTVCYIRAIMDPHSSSRVLGVLYVTHLETLLFNDIWDSQIPPETRSILVNERFEALASVPDLQLGSTIELPRKMKSAKDEYALEKWNGNDMLFTVAYNQTFRIRLIYEVPERMIIGEQADYQKMLLFMMVLCFLFVLGYLVYLLRLILHPLNKLSRITEKYEPGTTFSLSTMLSRNDEIGKMYGSFQRMTHRVNQMVEERYLLEMKHQEMELITLHTQITPHLLYNTLDSIYWSAIDRDAPELARMVKDLSSLLRIGLSRGKELVTVREEIQHIQAYIRLQMQRYQESFQVHWDISEDVLDGITPKVILQPIAENAILHGIGKMDGEGEMWIRAYRQEAVFIFVIEDNGFKPADPETLHRQMINGEGEGYGIRNVDRRIKLHFGPSYGIVYSLRLGGGTRAEIHLPFPPSEPEPL